MIDRIKLYSSSIQAAWKWLQGFLSIDGGLFVDAFAIVFLVRLLGPLRGYPAMNAPEAGMWAATIAAFAASNIGGPRPS